MIKTFTKYFVIVLCLINILFAQDKVITKNLVNNFWLNKNCFRLGCNLARDESDIKANDMPTKAETDNAPLKVMFNIYKQTANRTFLERFFNTRPNQDPHRKPENNIISSFSENIEVVGLYGKFAEIDFNPKLNIEPVSFISFSANQNLKCFVPIKNINEHVEALLIQSAYVVAVDNLTKKIFSSHNMIQSIVGFVAKNILNSFIFKTITNNSADKIYLFDNYNFSIKVKI